ncbi:mitochondrial inner membrane protease subunit 1 isoform X2 [Andrographis paniculata]|uniref:mitochondrial inner membrane protease subunit 1 isoform X2 n=1 Tax=Andrographis paniculata TaxID=175694 RepID=UPI0021E87C69|nr:mitochondrial inner membrane protease subunit 1 isoform X2 [Andrographis paniculata]XP_051151937.1 mitochondrial inner membrane protease subunit 1 isoform X2 [Andrographis paniculata]
MSAAKLLQYARQWKPAAKEVVRISTSLAQLFSLVHVLDTYVIRQTVVYGPSMLPTLNFTGDVLLVEKLSFLLGRIGPGDIVLLRSPENPRKFITKRILGMEGDTVTFLVDPGHSDRTHSLVVPKGHVWIQGDNIYSSKDSRNFGPVPYGLIVGRAYFRVWPPADFGSLQH